MIKNQHTFGYSSLWSQVTHSFTHSFIRSSLQHQIIKLFTIVKHRIIHFSFVYCCWLWLFLSLSFVQFLLPLYAWKGGILPHASMTIYEWKSHRKRSEKRVGAKGGWKKEWMEKEREREREERNVKTVRVKWSLHHHQQQKKKEKKKEAVFVIVVHVSSLLVSGNHV